MNSPPTYILTRQPDQSVQTLGMLDIDGKLFPTVELPWKDNQHGISCIPVGTYKIIRRYSEQIKSHFLIENVPDRDLCLIHAANFSRELKGCIAPGIGKHTDIDHDGLKDVVSSKVALMQLLQITPEVWYLQIK